VFCGNDGAGPDDEKDDEERVDGKKEEESVDGEEEEDEEEEEEEEEEEGDGGESFSQAKTMLTSSDSDFCKWVVCRDRALLTERR